MLTLRYKCRICKEVTEHKPVIVSDQMPPDVQCVECLSCGVLGIEMVAEAITTRPRAR